MIQATVARLGELVSAERVLIVTNKSLVEPIARELPQLSAAAVLGEPCRRDTAPCIGLAAVLVGRNDPDATMLVMPADHVIEPEESFRSAMRFAADLVDERPERLVTFGIRPSYAAETFGYIQRGEPLRTAVRAGAPPHPPAFRALSFREKPKAELALQYIEAGDTYWNSGIFVWKARTVLCALADHQPALFARLRTIAEAVDTPRQAEVLEREFAAIDPISIDFAVMERAAEVVLVEAPFNWDDVGGWQSLARLRGTDSAGNTIAGKHVGLKTTGTIVRASDDHLVVTLGLSDVIVVHTPDVTLVANKHDEESIRELVRIVEARGWTEHL